jgi:hypothetical protein
MPSSIVKIHPTTGTAEIIYADGTTKKIDFMPPFPGSMKNFRNSGYSLMETVLELVDNSASAESSTIKIVLFSDERNKLSGWAVVDNGVGMTLESMMEGFIIGAPKLNRAANDIGKFHTGLKSATIATGSYTVILTAREGSGVISGLVANYEQMSRANTHAPTHVESNVTEEWVCTHNIPKHLYDDIKSIGKGTVVYTTQILPKFQKLINNEISDLRIKLPLKYSIHGSHTLFVQHNDAEPERIAKKSFFYENEPVNLQDSRNYQINVYREENEDSETSHDLRVTITSSLQFGKKVIKATPEKPVTLQFQRTKTGRPGLDPVTKKTPSPKSQPVLVLVNPVLIRESVHEIEKRTYSETVPSRGYYHFSRGPRSVGQAYSRFTSTKLHDRAHTLQDRFRCSVTFPPALDEEFGVKHTKQMEDKEMPCADIADMILLLGRATFNEFTKEHHDGETMGTSVVSADESVDTEENTANVVVPTISEESDSAASSESEELSVERVEVRESESVTVLAVQETVENENVPVQPPAPTPKQLASDIISVLASKIALANVSDEKVEAMLPILEQLLKSVE